MRKVVVRASAESASVRFSAISWMAGVAFLGAAVFDGALAVVTYQNDPKGGWFLAGLSAFLVVIAMVGAWWCGRIWISSTHLIRVEFYVPLRIPRNKITAIQIRSGVRGAIPRDWIAIETAERTYDTKLLVSPGGKAAEEIREAAAALQRGLGLIDDPDWERLKRISRPINNRLNIIFRVGVLILFVIGCVAFVGGLRPISWICLFIFFFLLSWFGPLLPGGPQLFVDNGSIREAGKADGIRLESIRGFKVRSLEELLAGAQLVAVTDSGEVPYRSMRVTRRQVKKLEELAEMLNTRLLDRAG